MFRLELLKLKRRKLVYLLPLVLLALVLLEFAMGNQIYQGHRYGSVAGWYLENGLFFFIYYFLLPFSCLILTDLLTLERNAASLQHLKLIPISMTGLLKAKCKLTFFLVFIFASLFYVGMLVLEALDGHFALPFLAVLWWGLAYVTLCMVYVLLSTLILLGLGKIKKQMFFAGPVAFLLSFSALFLLTATLGQYYLINLPLLILKEGLSVPLFIYGIWLICLVILMWMLSQDKQVLSFLIDKE